MRGSRKLSAHSLIHKCSGLRAHRSTSLGSQKAKAYLPIRFLDFVFTAKNEISWSNCRFYALAIYFCRSTQDSRANDIKVFPQPLINQKSQNIPS